MYQPQEIEVWYVIPALRKEIAKELLKKGFKQREVSKKLGITEAAISQYLKSKRADKIKFNKEIKNKIRISVEKVLNEKSNFVKEIQEICGFIMKSKFICKISKNLGMAPKNCEVCFK